MLAVSLFVLSCFGSTGCDLGTYNQRLNEKPVAPAKEAPAEDSNEDAEADAGDADGSQLP
jgi:hypothetical protein